MGKIAILMLIAFCFTFYSVTNLAANLSSSDEYVAKLLSFTKEKTLGKRLEFFSAELLGIPYQRGALGEGKIGHYDQNPLYRFDVFDCETFVDTVMALTFSNSLKDFKRHINKIRYKDGKINFLRRNHFPSADWIPQNKKNGYIRELTQELSDHTLQAFAYVDRQNWIQHLTIDSIKLSLNYEKKHQLLRQLKNLGKEQTNNMASVTYIPLPILLNNLHIIKKIPNASLLFLVGKPSYLTNNIGTEMNIFHMGFAIWQHKKLYFRMASSRQGKTLDVPLIAYLKTYGPYHYLMGISIWSIQ